MGIRTTNWGVRPTVVTETVSELKRVAQNPEAGPKPSGGGVGWVTAGEVQDVGQRLRSRFKGLTGPELNAVRAELGAQFLDARPTATAPNAVDQLGDAVDAVDALKPLVATEEAYFAEEAPVDVDLSRSTPLAARSQPLNLSISQEKLDGMVAAASRDAHLTMMPVATPASRLGASTQVEPPYLTEPTGILELSGNQAAMLAGQAPPYDVWAAGKNRVDNNWGHAYVGQFASTMFSKVTTAVLGAQNQSPITEQLVSAAGDVFGAAVMRAKEEFDKHVTPDDVPLTVRRTFRFKVSPTETITVTPQFTFTMGDMKTFDPTKGSQYFSVKVDY